MPDLDSLIRSGLVHLIEKYKNSIYLNNVHDSLSCSNNSTLPLTELKIMRLSVSIKLIFQN